MCDSCSVCVVGVEECLTTSVYVVGVGGVCDSCSVCLVGVGGVCDLCSVCVVGGVCDSSRSV